MDLDHFKAVNDTYGHPVGDRVLRELADRLRVLTRPEDEFARVGGEEFALILPECDPPAAIAILERMRRVVAGAPFAEVRQQVTISIGVAHLASANGPNELYQQADEALYLAKDEGRDRVASWVRGLVAAPVAGAGESGERQRTVEGILALARAVDARDPGMRRHSGRVADLAVRLATVLGWRIEDCALLRDAGLVHDVGKIGVSDGILLKAGRLTDREREEVRLHAALGAQIARDVLTDDQVAWVRSHHERWDGGGYPEGLAGEQIPPGARILAVADAFDHMTAARTYSRTRTVEEAVAECHRAAGTQFAPEVVVALERLATVGALARSDTA
jgi:diguanylate cyclase (GGDEF)-like protein/putative nucleotidyltransferase with HDIG domain